MKELTVTKIHFHSLHPSNNTKIFFKKNHQPLQGAIALPNEDTIPTPSHSAAFKSISCVQLKDQTHRTLPSQSTSAFPKKKNKCLIISIPYNLTISKQHSTVSTNTRGCHRQFIITSYTNPKCTVHATSYILNSVGD